MELFSHHLKATSTAGILGHMCGVSSEPTADCCDCCSYCCDVSSYCCDVMAMASFPTDSRASAILNIQANWLLEKQVVVCFLDRCALARDSPRLPLKPSCNVRLSTTTLPHPLVQDQVDAFHPGRPTILVDTRWLVCVLLSGGTRAPLSSESHSPRYDFASWP